MVDKKQLELNSLLELTTAINENTPEESLYRIFYFTCITHLKFEKIALFVFDEDEAEYKLGRSIEDIAGAQKELQNLEFDFTAQFIADSFTGLEEFQVIVPVKHKQKRLACLLLGGMSEDHISEYEITELNFIRTIANMMMVAIENKRFARTEMKRLALRRELEIAQQVQNMLFPSQLPDNDTVSIHSSYLPHSDVGGDFYDFIPLGEQEFIICIADVSGKGVPAALLMSNFQASLRSIVKHTSHLFIIVKELNEIIHKNSQGERFITLFIAKYNTDTRVLKYINAGHNPPLLVTGYEVQTLDRGTVVLGPFEELPFVNKGRVSIPQKSTLLLYTDGITETVNNKGEEFGEERLIKIFKEGRAASGVKLHEQIIVSLDLFKEEQGYGDDLTLLSCEIK